MEILAVTADDRLVQALAEQLGPGADIVREHDPTVGSMKLLLDQPRLLICDAPGEGPEGLSTVRKLLRTAALRHTPVLVITGWRGLLDDRSHFVHENRGDHAVLFRPFSDEDLGHQASSLLCREGP